LLKVLSCARFGGLITHLGAKLLVASSLQGTQNYHSSCLDRQVAKKKKWISDATYAAIREKKEAKGKDKKRYKELKAEVQRKLRVDKQQQLEGMCVELEAVNRLKRKFQEALPDSQIYD